MALPLILLLLIPAKSRSFRLVAGGGQAQGGNQDMRGQDDRCHDAVGTILGTIFGGIAVLDRSRDVVLPES